jgi:hypothetical protein
VTYLSAKARRGHDGLRRADLLAAELPEGFSEAPPGPA